MGTKYSKIELLTEKKIQESLKLILSQPRFILNNLYVFGWESDVLILTKSGYWYEFEIKISKSDFKNDFKHKNDKHVNMLSNQLETRKPNYFNYVVPENLISIEEIPEYAGLIYITESGRTKTIKNAPKLHREKVDPNKLGLLDKFYYNMQNAKFSEKISLIKLKDTEEKYSDTRELERRSKEIGFNDCYSLTTKAFMETCDNYIKNDETQQVICGKNSRGNGWGKCRGNCEELDRFLNLIDKNKITQWKNLNKPMVSLNNKKKHLSFRIAMTNYVILVSSNMFAKPVAN